MFVLTGIWILIIMLLVAVFCFGVPLLIGLFVYRDANKRVDCAPWLWAIVAALVPSFIGLIIYLVIRGDYPLKQDRRADSDENYYYTENYEKQEAPVNPAKQGMASWLKALIIVVAVVLVLCLVALAVSFTYYMVTGAQSCDPTPYINGF